MKNLLSNRYIILFSRLVLGIIFIIASSDKIAHPELFALSISGYKLLPLYLINLFAIVLPWLEMITGLFLISGIFVKSSSAILAFLITVFIGAISLAMIQKLEIDCGCFGAGKGSQVGWLRIIEDIGMLILCGHIYYFYRDPNLYPKN
ncbi:MAG: DoxX family membrane protein [Ignavibacteriales bacterium]|nr:DoxX family membrane protein [Ignavibacteriales bacterium]